MSYHVRLVEVLPQLSAVVRARVGPDGLGGFVGEALSEVMEVLGQQGLAPAGPPFSRYLVDGEGFEVETGFPTPGVVVPQGRVVASELPGGAAAATLHTGAYDRVAGAYSATARWLSDRGMSASDAPWESYLDGPDVAEPRTEVFMPCTPSGPGPGG